MGFKSYLTIEIWVGKARSLISRWTLQLFLITAIVNNPSFSINKLKTFSDYDGTTKGCTTCTLNKKVKKGNYLVYIYRDSDHAEFTPDSNMDIQIACSSKCRYNQMQFDLREDGFPLLQNIIYNPFWKK